ncbi:hypothetical protein NXS19_011653 [Fusarium pseudograminearum]|nr:hypothetical protein NXS19_011653 [Fusarium pseudograminearum]
MKRYTKDQIRDRVQFVDSLACWAGLRHQLNTGCNISNSTALPVKVQRSTVRTAQSTVQTPLSITTLGN